MSTGDEYRASANDHWFKSSHSNDMGGACVEVSTDGPVVAMRDSTDPIGPRLTLPSGRWRRLLNMIKAGAYDQAR